MHAANVVVRLQMVNRGPSTGCMSCRQGRVKCDEGKPICKRCTVKSLECVYGKAPVKFRFKDETLIVQSKSQRQVHGANQLTSALLDSALLPEDRETSALNFFFRYFAATERGVDSGHGFFETIVPIYTEYGARSAVIPATAANSAFFYGRAFKDVRMIKLSRMRLIEAARLLRTQLADLRDGVVDDILLNIQLMQCYETTQAMVNMQTPMDMHRNGALNLIKSLGLEHFRSFHAKRLLLYIFTVEVNAAIRECRPVEPAMSRWIAGARVLPWNPSSRLSLVGQRIAFLRVGTSKLAEANAETNGRDGFADSAQKKEAVILRIELMQTATDLDHWASTLPGGWQSFRCRPMRTPSRSIDLFDGIFDVYATIDVAVTWTLWRVYLLMLYDISFQLRRISVEPSSCIPERLLETLPDVEELINSICYSVPFFVGDRTEPEIPGSRALLSAIYPSYRNLDLFGCSIDDRNVPPNLISQKDHVDHASAHGAWQAAVVLGQMGALLPQLDHGKPPVSARTKQISWIMQQLRRASIMLGVNR